MKNLTPSILDFEASGFGAQSYPIEVGVVRSDGKKFCSLIRPFDDWIHWDEHAQSLHGISRSHLLSYGRPGIEVCQQLNELLQGETAYSDGWVVDSPWMTKLFARAGVSPSFRLSALEYVLNERQMADWRITKEQVLSSRQESRHRASSDAEVIQQTYMMTAGLTLRA